LKRSGNEFAAIALPRAFDGTTFAQKLGGDEKLKQRLTRLFYFSISVNESV
jgi:hypothetical protein